ncbi:MAG: hypothetical protein JKY54_06560 [Flavobacteriales bacterium]|nr:hypothetical protein [Flavobacteriales bacterium]
MRSLLVGLGLLVAQTSIAQGTHLWLTYGQAKFVYAPAVEADVHCKGKFGIHGAAGAFIHVFEPNQVVNREFRDKVGLFYGNLGASYQIYNVCQNRIMLNVGAVFYFGPDYVPLYFYQTGGYQIYYDQSRYLPDFGLDIGCSYTRKRISGILKFDTARNQLRIGLGYLLSRKVAAIDA